MKKLRVATLVVALTIPFLAAEADASVGGKCAKAGRVDQLRGLKCVRRGGKLTWTQFYVVPGAVGGVWFSNVNSTLTWSNPATWGNPVASYFAVDVRSSLVPVWTRIADLPNNRTSASLSNMTVGVSYEFRVAAGSSFGLGAFGYSQPTVFGSTGVGTTATTTTTIGSQQTTTTSTTTTTVAQTQRTSFGNGTFRVGTDIQPGLYQSSTTGSCYWERMSGFSGSLDDIIANENVTGRAIVQIKSTDAGFKSSRCGAWSPYSPFPTSSFGAGVWKVGEDIAPGMYRTTSANRCYWARLSGFGGELDDILDNDNADGSDVVVQILPGDAGFESSRCGTWTKVG